MCQEFFFTTLGKNQQATLSQGKNNLQWPQTWSNVNGRNNKVFWVTRFRKCVIIFSRAGYWTLKIRNENKIDSQYKKLCYCALQECYRNKNCKSWKLSKYNCRYSFSPWINEVLGNVILSKHVSRCVKIEFLVLNGENGFGSFADHKVLTSGNAVKYFI